MRLRRSAVRAERTVMRARTSRSELRLDAQIGGSTRMPISRSATLGDHDADGSCSGAGWLADIGEVGDSGRADLEWCDCPADGPPCAGRTGHGGVPGTASPRCQDIGRYRRERDERCIWPGAVRTRVGLRHAISTVLGAFAGAYSVATGYQVECGVRTTGAGTPPSTTSNSPKNLTSTRPPYDRRPGQHLSSLRPR